jgi:hypothetical protein
LLAHGRWFSPGTPASSTTKTGHHEIAEILLKVALNTKNQLINQSKGKWHIIVMKKLETMLHWKYEQMVNKIKGYKL